MLDACDTEGILSGLAGAQPLADAAFDFRQELVNHSNDLVCMPIDPYIHMCVCVCPCAIGGREGCEAVMCEIFGDKICKQIHKKKSFSP